MVSGSWADDGNDDQGGDGVALVKRSCAVCPYGNWWGRSIASRREMASAGRLAMSRTALSVAAACGTSWSMPS
jgi:hypothetical protein